MILGLLPSETVREALHPVLGNAGKCLAELPVDIQDFVFGVLRVYPEIGDRYGIVPPAKIGYLLMCLKSSLSGNRSRPQSEEDENDFAGMEAAEKRRPFHSVKIPERAWESFRTGDGNPFSVSAAYDPDAEEIVFECRGTESPVGLFICGILFLRFESGEGTVRLNLKRFQASIPAFSDACPVVAAVEEQPEQP